MAFTQAAFIKENTPELREALRIIGYTYCGRDKLYGEPTYLYCNSGSFYEVSKIPSSHRGIIDCGNNRDLFLTLASLRNDTQNNQWYIGIETIWDENYYGEITVYVEEGEWYLYDEWSIVEDMPSAFRKATATDIVKRFEINGKLE